MIRSRGIFTANYNITINVSVTLPKRTAEFCQGKMMQISIPGARLNQSDLNAVMILMHEMPGLADARFYNEAKAIFEKLGNQSGIATTLGQLGRLAEARKDLEAAEHFYKEAYTIFEKIGEKPNIELAKKDLERVQQLRKKR